MAGQTAQDLGKILEIIQPACAHPGETMLPPHPIPGTGDLFRASSCNNKLSRVLSFQLRRLSLSARLCSGVFTALLGAGLMSQSVPVHAQQVPTASASSAATAAGTTVNNQNNSQVNTNTFYGFGPGINCPTPTLAVAGFGGSGSGLSSGDLIGAQVSSDNYGGIISFTLPLGGANAEICKEIGRAQVQALQSQVVRATVEARKTQADINLVTAIKCVEILRVASLSGQFGQLCQGVIPRGMGSTATAELQPVRQRFEP